MTLAIEQGLAISSVSCLLYYVRDHMLVHATCIPVHMLLYLSRALDKYREAAMIAQHPDLLYAMPSHIQLTITACSALCTIAVCTSSST